VQHPCDIEQVLAGENVEVVRFPLEGRLDEMIVFNFIAVRDSIEDARQVYELLAHALGHYLLHAGNQIEFVLPTNMLLADQWERQSWEFAFELFMPANLVAARLLDRWSDADLQEDFEVSADFLSRRMESFRRNYAMQSSSNHRECARNEFSDGWQSTPNW